MADFSCIPFSFCRNGEPVAASAARQETFSSVTEGDKRLTKTIFHFADGLNVTQSVTEYLRFGATYRRLQWHYTGEQNSATYSQLMDADFEIAAGAVTRCIGDRAALNNFENVTETPEDGQTLSYTTADSGRPTWFEAPYYDIAQPDGGLIMTIGWSGTWRASFTRNGDCLRVTAGIDGVETYLKPDEAIKTASVLLLPYTGDRDVAHNVFRRLLKEEFSLIGKEGRPKTGPVSMNTWGADYAYEHLERIKTVAANFPQVDHYWIDAGWFGADTAEDQTEAANRWFNFVGHWSTINPSRYPNGMEEVADCVKANGLNFLLWIESERAVFYPDFPMTHPEWYLQRKDDNRHFWNIELDEGADQAVLNLGCPEGLNLAKQTAFDLIDKYDIRCLRQDFNVLPAVYWNDNDEEGRKGMCQIRYVNGLYAFWDAVLERYPHILIDNCAGGGTRLEIEMLRRSVVLWRSDFAHGENSHTVQFQTEALAWWLPYFGGGNMQMKYTSVKEDITYRLRSMYATTLMLSWRALEGQEEAFPYIRTMLEEYVGIRSYLLEDYYAVFGQSLSLQQWGGWQFDRPEKGDGILMAFCRDEAPLQTTVKLKGLCADATYALTDRDSGNVVTATGRELMENGLPLSVSKTRTSLLIEYKKI